MNLLKKTEQVLDDWKVKSPHGFDLEYLQTLIHAALVECCEAETERCATVAEEETKYVNNPVRKNTGADIAAAIRVLNPPPRETPERNGTIKLARCTHKEPKL